MRRGQCSRRRNRAGVTTRGSGVIHHSIAGAAKQSGGRRWSGVRGRFTSPFYRSSAGFWSAFFRRRAARGRARRARAEDAGVVLPGATGFIGEALSQATGQAGESIELKLARDLRYLKVSAGS